MINFAAVDCFVRLVSCLVVSHGGGAQLLHKVCGEVVRCVCAVLVRCWCGVWCGVLVWCFGVVYVRGCCAVVMHVMMMIGGDGGEEGEC